MTDGRDLPVRVIDSHIHQWDPLSTPREISLIARPLHYFPALYFPAILNTAFKLFPKSERESIADPLYLANPYVPAHYAADARGLQVESVVHVESGWRGRGDFASVDETKWIASLPFGEHSPPLGAIVAAADPTEPDFAAVLDAHLAASSLVRGVRTIAAYHPDHGVRSWSKTQRLLVAPRFLNGFAQLAERNLAFDAWVYSHDLPDVAELARRYPEVDIVLDHFGTPAGVLGPVGRSTGRSATERRGLLDAWRDDIAAVAERSNVVAKLSGLTLPILGHQLPLRGHSVPVSELVERIGPLVRHTLDVFGPERVMWGSNAPMEKPVSSMVGVAAAVIEILGGRRDGSPDEIDQVFRRTAQRVYKIKT